MARGAARASDAHEEVSAERVVELLDLGKHAHGRMVRSGGVCMCASTFRVLLAPA